MRLFVFILLLVIGIGACMSYRELPVEYDYSFKGRFHKYNSYDFFSVNEFQGDDTLNIRSSIEQHMNFLGYKRKKNKPDLYLNYAIFKDSLKFRGYDQPDINVWAKRRDNDLEYEKLNFDLRNGTLLIQVFDRKMNSSIWQGYATDTYQKMDFYNNQEVRNAVKSILNKYQFFADGFIEEQIKKSKDNN
jgi:hypothetical protein